MDKEKEEEVTLFCYGFIWYNIDMKKKTINRNRSPRLDIPFTKWMTDRLLTSEGFRDLAAKRGVKLNLTTVLKWRIGTKPRKATRAALERKFPTIVF